MIHSKLMISKIVCTVLLLSSAFFQGCASVAKGTNQSLSVITPGCDGASCKLTNNKGEWFVTTPGSVTVHRSSGALTIVCKHETTGEAETIGAEDSSTGGWVFGNILVGGVIGAGVDIINGAAYDYSSTISVPMSCDAEGNEIIASAETEALNEIVYQEPKVAEDCKELQTKIDQAEDGLAKKVLNSRWESMCKE